MLLLALPWCFEKFWNVFGIMFWICLQLFGSDKRQCLFANPGWILLHLGAMESFVVFLLATFTGGILLGVVLARGCLNSPCHGQVSSSVRVPDVDLSQEPHVFVSRAGACFHLNADCLAIKTKGVDQLSLCRHCQKAQNARQPVSIRSRKTGKAWLR